LVLLLSSAAWLPLLHPGFLSTRAGGDSPFLLIRLDQLLHNLRAGVFPARWMPDAAYGLGYPFFNYYAALPYYLAAGLVLCGWGSIAALKATQAIGFLASGAAMYALARHTLRRRCSALLAAVAYVYTPFHLVNVYVRGDSLSEFYAYVWYPLLGWAILRLRHRASARNVLLLAGVYGGLVLTHNISALIATPVAFAYALLLLFSDGERGPRCSASLPDRPSTKASRTRFLLAGLAGGLLGLGLSSWFWLPAFLERHLVQLEGMTTGYFHFTGHFRGMDLLQRKWLFDYTIGKARSPFSMGLVQALMTGLGLLAVISGWIRRRRLFTQGAFALAVLLVTTLCITPLSRPLWEHVPLLQLAQFPWRFLSVQAVFTSFLIGALAEGLPRAGQEAMVHHRVTVTHLVLTAVVVLLLIGSALGNLRPEWMAIGEDEVAADRLRLYEYFTGNIGTTVRWEYLPRTVETRPFTSAVFLNQGGKSPPMPIEGEVTAAHLLDVGPIWEVWEIVVVSPQARLAFHTLYFPGWHAVVDGSPHPLSPVEGWGTMGLTLSQGRHRVGLRLGRTPLRRAGELMSLLALIIALVLLARTVHPRDRHWPSKAWWWHRGGPLRPLRLMGLVVPIFVLGVAGLDLWVHRPRTRPTGTVSTQDLTMDFVRQPYLHHNPEGVRFADEARLLYYTLSANEIQAGEPLTVTLAWQATVDMPLTATLRLSSASKPLFDESPFEVKASVPLRAGRSVHRLEIPSSAVSGPYLLAVRLRHADGTSTPVTLQGQELGTTYLRPVWVKASGLEAATEEPLARFGQRIVLLAAEAERGSDERLQVHLAWQPLQPIPANYNLSLRLKDALGRQLSVRDLQPHYGFYPTSLWSPGVAVKDTLSLSVPEDTPSAGRYTLEVILYRVSTLDPIGRAEIDVHLAE